MTHRESRPFEDCHMQDAKGIRAWVTITRFLEFAFEYAPGCGIQISTAEGDSDSVECTNERRRKVAEEKWEADSAHNRAIIIGNDTPLSDISPSASE